MVLRTGPQHDRGVAGVGAAGDGCDDHGPVGEGVLFVFKLEGNHRLVALCSHLEPLKALL